MKKVMLFMGFMAFVFITHATELPGNAGNKNIQSGSQVNKGYAAVDLLAADDFQCTVTQKGTVSIYFVTYEISCSSTGSNCKVASAEALSCVREGINQLRQIMK